MKKIVLLLVMIFIITGCSVKYNITINEDLTLTEEAKLTGTKDFFENYYKTTKKNVLKSIVEVYQDYLTENNYSYELIDDNPPYILMTRTYDSVNDYVNNKISFNGYFDEVKYTEDGDIKRIETFGYMENEIDNPDRFDIKELEITIKCPYKVREHNAKNVDKTTNTYYYKLDSDNDKILIEYDVSSKFNPNDELIRTLIISLIIIIASIFIAIYMTKKNKNK